MSFHAQQKHLWILALTAGVIFAVQLRETFAQTADETDASASSQIQFNRDIRPILSDRCFLCHGPDQSSEQSQESDLRLDHRDSAVDYDIFDFDNIDESTILHLVTSDDSDERMPPPKSSKEKLNDAQVELLRRWIEQGAKYESHWSYSRADRPTVPVVVEPSTLVNPIDAFVQSSLASKGIGPAKPADRETLIRRVTLDLTGLPPSVAQVASFVDDPSPLETAYEKVVERLLASSAYGEHMARHWLDAARYADTSGYQYDFQREQWVWRDWVIHAFNQNMPFDQFTIHQIAGDMLPETTDQTILATGFNRNHPITVEGGVIDEEYRTEYVIDRVVTTSTVFLGQTFTCSRCHDHKYDPISQREFYQFFAFFNNVPEKGHNGFAPKKSLRSPLADDVQRQLNAKLAAAEAEFKTLEIPLEDWASKLSLERKPAAWKSIVPQSVESLGGASTKLLDDQSTLITGDVPGTDEYQVLLPPSDEQTGSLRLEALTDPSLPHGSASHGFNGNFVLTELVVEAAPVDAPKKFAKIKIESAAADYEQKNFPVSQAIDGERKGNSGWAVDGNLKRENRTATFSLAEPVPAGSPIRVSMIFKFGRSHQIGRFRISVSPRDNVDEKLDRLLAEPVAEQTKKQRDTLRRELVKRFGDQAAKDLLAEVESAAEALANSKKFPETFVMEEMPTPREAYVLDRGEYDKPRKDDPLVPGVPAALGALPEEFPKNRLGLAKWLVSRDQPLTARVTVNRFWQQLFGVGIVKTSEDFGSQGEYPLHRELLDWLAVEFMESGWDVKGLFKTMVMSGTYRQSSSVTGESYAADPENRMLARGPRVRLEGEAIRDAALAVSGLLEPELGGPSVYPYHPKGLWLEINNRPNYSSAYPHKKNPLEHHRRSMYTFWKRTVPPPSMAAFDAPGREYCVVRRSRTNTPLQAFVMLHDPQFVEAAIHLASRMIRQGGDSPRSQIEYGFQLCTSRKPTERELAVLLETQQEALTRFRGTPEKVDQLLSIGVTPANNSLRKDELAAMVQVGRMLMNLSEFLTKG